MKPKYFRLRKRSFTQLGMAILSGGMMFLGAARADVLLDESFDGIPLGPFVSGTESGGDGTDWADFATAQSNGQLAAWTLDNSTTPAPVNAVEFYGWNFMDPASFNATAGQGRGLFTRGTGVIAVADGDEYDDGTSIGPNLLNTFLITPTIDLSSVDPAKLIISFDSSFRPYASQQGLVDVSFDGGSTWANALTLDGTTVAGGNSSNARINSQELLLSGTDFSPNGTDMVVRFGYINAGNDWWWAIDNVRVSVDEPILTSLPSPVTTFESTTAEFTVGVAEITPGSTSFQWYFDDGLSRVALTDQTSRTLILTGLQQSDEGLYDVEVTLGTTTITTTPVQLTVAPVIPPVIHFEETFDELPFGPFVSASEGGGTGTDWVNLADAQTGGSLLDWVLDTSTTPAPDLLAEPPVPGPVEFFGWTFMQVDSWITTAGNQERTSFTRAKGGIAVADPDEYDDLAPGIEPDLFNVFLATSAISVLGTSGNDLTLQFDSSFRPYDGMTGAVEVSFDAGATWTNLLTLDTANSGGESSLSRANENIKIPLGNPAGDVEALVRFGMTNAGNDWWWAVDNIRVYSGPFAPPTIARNPRSVTALGGDPDPVELTVIPDGIAPFTYQWYLGEDDPLTPGDDRTLLPTQTSGTLSISSPAAADSGVYTVDITTLVGDVTTCGILNVVPALVDLQPLNYTGSNALIAGGELLFLDVIVKSFDSAISYRVLKLDEDELSSSFGEYVEVPGTGGDEINIPADVFYDKILNEDTGLCCHELTFLLDLADSVTSPGVYKIEATNQYGTVETNTSTVEVVNLVITEDPLPALVNEGDSVLFSAVADTIEDPLTYQWFKGLDDPATTDVDERIPVPGASGSADPGLPVEFLLPVVAPADRGIYTVDFTIPQGTVRSGSAYLTVFSPEGSQVVFKEDFEELPLGASPEENPASLDVWTQTPPAGWDLDNSGVPGFGDPATDGIADWAGWSFAVKDWWIAEAGDQDRSQFTRGIGTVAIADGDEWKDSSTPAGSTLNTFLTTPLIDISGAPEGTVVLGFDSSFRPYDNQTGAVEISLDGGLTFEQVLLLDTPTGGGNSSTSRINERVSLAVPNTALTPNLQVRFGLTDAANDWWWAIDNLCLTVKLPTIELLDITFDGTSLLGLTFESDPSGTYTVQYVDENTGQYVDLASGITGQIDSTTVALDLSPTFSPVPTSLLVRVLRD